MATPSLLLIPDRYKAGLLYSQLPESGAGDITFTRGSTATRVNAQGLIESVASGVPRLDYTGGGCPSLLLEPQRANLLTWSEDFTNANWTKDGITVTANATTSPDGSVTADKLVASASNGDKVTFQVQNVSIGVAYTASAYYKASEYTYAFMRLGGIANNPYVIYDLSTQELVSSAVITSSSITFLGNGWYRITATATTTSGVLAPNVMVIPSNGYILPADNIPEFTGDGTSGGFIWGAQLEAGSYPTSYIKTEAASATRLADVASKTGISSLIGQTEGTVYLDFVATLTPGQSQSHIWISGGSGNEIGIFGGSQFAFYSDGGVNFVTINIVEGQRYKIAFAYAVNNYVAYINGVLVGSDTSATVPATSAIYINSYTDGSEMQKKNINTAALYPTRLSNSELQAITTL